MDTYLNQFVETLKCGGVIVYPTDTACGIGCRIDDEHAVRRVYEIKGRDLGKAVPVLCSSIDMVNEYIQSVSSDVKSLMEAYWPGALTIVVRAKVHDISPLVLGEDNTIGVRIPGEERIRQIIEAVGVPIVGTSANLAGEPTVYNTQDVNEEVRMKVDQVLEGDCPQKKSSTVLDATQYPWVILRQGAVQIEEKKI